MTHIESRPTKDKHGKEYDFYIEFELPNKDTKNELLTQLAPLVGNIAVHSKPEKNKES